MRHRGPSEAFSSGVQADWQTAKIEYYAGLDAARPNNRWMRKRRGLGGSGCAHLSPYQLWFVRETARHMMRNDPLPGQVTEGLADAIVGHGYRHDPQTGDKGLNDELTGRFSEWADDPLACDWYGERTLHQLAWQAMLQEIGDGEIFGPLVDDGSVQLMEADYCVSPPETRPAIGQESRSGRRIWNGIEFRNGRREAYYFADGVSSYSPAVNPKGVTRYPARDERTGIQVVLHCYATHRVTARRGYTWWHPVMKEAGMLDDLDFSMVLKAQMAAAQAGIMERDPNAQRGDITLGEETIETADDGSTQTEVKIKPGAFVFAPPGATPKMSMAAIPNAEHLNHVKYILKKIGAGLHYPYCVLLLDASETNFTGWRGALNAARKTWIRVRGGHAAQFYRPIYIWQVMRMLPTLGQTARRYAADGRLFKHRWIAPRWEYIKPSEDARADVTIVDGHLDSRRAVLASRGVDEDQVRAETVADNKQFILDACAAAAAIREAYPAEQVTWQDVARWSLPQGLSRSGGLDAIEELASREENR